MEVRTKEDTGFKVEFELCVIILLRSRCHVF